MSFKRPQIHRIDRNHHELVAEWERLGGVFLKHPPLDGWLWLKHWNAYYPVEIKDPSREGHKDEYTPAQQKFIAEAKRLGAAYFTWRTKIDVQRTAMREEGVL